MILAVVLVVIAVLSLAIILRLAVGRSLQASAGTSLAAQIQPLDVEAFRNLTSPGEDEFLRRRLPASEFRRVRRARLRAASAYVLAAGKNAAVLVRLGQTALPADDASTSEAAHQLVDQALLLRRNCAFALLRIHIALALPVPHQAPTRVLRGYEQLNGCALLLTRLQNPAAPVRISAS
ncbi:MAG: hypothetical protein WAN03_12885 [Candidatus Sulfotelmatobacter sp.]